MMIDIQKLSKFAIWRHNLLSTDSEKLIKCSECGFVQNKVNWDYQTCEKCSHYMYDYREDIRL